MAKKEKKSKPKKEKKEKPKKEKKAKELDPSKAAKVHGMRFSGARTRKAQMNAYTGMAAGLVLVAGAATGFLYVQGKKIAPGDGSDPVAPLKVHDDGGRFQIPAN